MLPMILVRGTRLVSVTRRQWQHRWVFPSLAVLSYRSARVRSGWQLGGEPRNPNHCPHLLFIALCDGGKGAMRWQSPDGNGTRPFPRREQERAERVERMKGQQQRILHFGLASA
jgi:hypothetical protein